MKNAVRMPNPNDIGSPNRHEAGEKEGFSGIKRRKCNKTVTACRRVSKQSSTTKKNVLVNRIKETASSDSVQKIDLRLEAKLSAEEYSRMFAGQQIHPFFSLWKLGKKSQELDKRKHCLCTDRREDGRISGPVHIFENCQVDGTSSLDWNNWTFLGKTTIAKYSSEAPNLPVLMNGQLSLLPDILQEISLANSAVPDDQPICPSKSDDAKMDLELDGVSTFSGQAGCFRSSDTQPPNRFLQESMKSYYHKCQGKSGSLWIHKYKPTKAFEVCGNYESVNFLHEWLKLWKERRKQSRMHSANGDQSDLQDYDYNGSDCDSDLENVHQDKFLRNLLLITGPVGSGKSAAVYACAQEQGFDVLELNTSDWRNGTAVKQYFGDALGSHGFKRLLDHTLCSREKKTVKLPSAPAFPNDKAAEDIDKDVIELITISDDGSQSPDGTSWSLHRKSSEFTCYNVQTLILVEDVDVLFPEDRGCISAIQHIAKTAKGPIILTSNSNKVGLPGNFEGLNISFSLPLADELLCHLYMVCVTEDINSSPLLLERFIQSCNGDIRKIIMQLQFWFQSKNYAKDQKVQTFYSSIPFDLEATHQILPKIIPWSFPSEFSKLIETEVARLITIVEEDSCMQGLRMKGFHAVERKFDSDVQSMDTNYVDTAKRNRSISKCSQSDSQYSSTMSELSSCSGLLGISSWQNCQKKPVISSGSVNKDPNDNGQSTYFQPYNGQTFEVNNESPCKFQSETYTSKSFHKLACSGLDDCKCSGTAEVACLTENRIGTTFSAVTSDLLSGPTNSFPNNNITPFTLSDYQGRSKFLQKFEPLDARIQESYSTAAVQDFRDENNEATSLYDTTRDEFKPKSELDSNLIMETDVVQNMWRKLRDHRMDLGQHGTAEQLGAIQVVKLASGLSNLLSEDDLLFRNHQEKECGIMEHPKFLSDEATFNWYNEQAMMSTIAVHGFCFYAKCISDVGSMFGFEPENNTDITSEMLASTTNVMTLGKLSRQDHKKITTLYTNKQLELKKTMNDTKSESKTSLMKVIQSIVPTRLSLALKGTAFNEYLSTVRQISISEGLRILQGVEKKRGKRARSAQHYLSRCTMMSPEDISLVCQGDLYSKMSSQFAAEVKSNCT
ncbi:uncharacterized protein LOC107469773 isoform X4 [Arachis duranensis]|uniref:Uncharacterized protein LOC107469773 isoform X4 n=1 Tax=Arachis duranensis TaxID=130453 RepID=A0A9C6WMC3_ARADU|nr:uncharacterized protein LOC112715660 isoform X4 [Arachis hypogaea]XP_052111259.1 uncharacterized protein LOC107469773 isoform X4 [Arachis duranensis]